MIEQLLVCPLVGRRGQVAVFEFLKHPGIDLARVKARAGGALEIDHATVAFQAIPRSVRKRDILQPLPDPSFGRRLEGLADGAIARGDKEHRHAVRRALGVDDVMQTHLAVVMNQAFDLQKSVQLLFVQVLQAHDGAGTRHPKNQQAAGRVGERRDAFLDLVADVPELRLVSGAVCLWPTSFLAVEMLALKDGIRRGGNEIPVGIRLS